MAFLTALFTVAVFLSPFPSVSALEVKSVEPADGAVNVPAPSNIRIDFDAPVDPLTITGEAILVNGKPLSSIPGAAITLPEPSSAVLLMKMTPNNRYEICIPSSAKDAAGTAISKAFCWSFVTSSRLDDPLTPVRIFARYPRMNDRDIPINAPITMTFTTAMSPASFKLKSIMVTRTNGGMPVVGDTEIKGRRVVFRPSRLLAPNQTYEVKVSEEVLSNDGLALGKEAAWQFTTGSGPAEGPIVTDAWQELYSEPSGRRAVLHASVEVLTLPSKDGKPVVAEEPQKLPAGFQLVGSVMPLKGVIDLQPLSEPLFDKKPQILPPDPSKDTVVVAAYTHGGGAGAGNSVSGNTKGPGDDKVLKAQMAALAGLLSAKLSDSGDAARDGDAAAADGVYSARLTLPDDLPGGPAQALFAVRSPGEDVSSPVVVPTYIQPSRAESEERGK